MTKFSAPTVLLLSTYPFAMPRHGGQVRLANIAKTYAAAGLRVESIAVFEPEAYQGAALGLRDIPFPLDSRYRKFDGRDLPFVNDLQSGRFAAAQDGGFDAIRARLPGRIDAIHVEQPWLWPLASRIKQIAAYNKTILVYGSANIEQPLKAGIFESFAVQDAQDAVEAVGVLERRAAVEADLCLAVCQADQQALLEWGARSCLLAPNGIAPWTATPEALSHWKKRLPEAPWILYVASAHPPNFTGFVDCVGESLGCIPPDSRLVVVGSVGEHLYRLLVETRWNSLNLSRLELLGLLSDADLAAVKCLAHAYLLPIQHGGGSNLKTAEALYSGAYVICSPTALRGFEAFVRLPETFVCHSPADWRRAMRDVLTRPKIETCRPGRDDLREQLRWDRCLAELSHAVGRLMTS